MAKTGLVAVLALFAILPATAAADAPITTVTVNDSTTDARLAPAYHLTACVSEDVQEGCTLRAAIELANEESKENDEVVTVDVPAETFGNTEEYGTFRIAPYAKVIVTGAGVGKTLIEGVTAPESTSESIFTVEEGASFTVQGVTLLHGYAEAGNGDGGAIYAEPGASVTVEGSAVKENGAENSGGGIYGGDYSYEKLGASITIKHSTVADNFAAGFEEGGNGGGVYGEPGAYVTIEEESVIAENTASRNGGGVSAGTGELVYNEGCDTRGAKSAAKRAKGEVQPGPGGSAGLTIKDSKVEENTAEGDGGGGVYVSQGEEEEEEICEEARGQASTGSAKSSAAGSTDEGVLLIEQSTVANNDASRGSGGGVAALNYGGCDDESDVGLTVKQSTIAKNMAEGEDGDGDGGGMYVGSEQGRYCDGARSAHSAKKGADRATDQPYFEESGLTIEQSTIAENRAGTDGGGYGGGIYEEVEYDDPIVNSTIADNAAGDDGGGVYAADADVGALISDTLSDNIAEGDTGNNVAGGYSGSIELRNTILAEQPGEHQQNCEGEIEPFIPGAGYNLDYPSILSDGSDSCGLSEEDHDLVGVKPELDAKGLQGNGGPTETIALLAASPAIGFVPMKEDCEEEGTGPALPNEKGESTPVDQRGVERPGIPGKGCDIGAYEYQEPPKSETKPTPEEKPAASATATTSVLPFKAVVPAQCTSQRDITIHIQHVKAFGVISAVVSIDGHAKRTLRGKQLTTAINLRGLPKGTFTVEIVAHTRSGHTLRGKRVYHTCHIKLPGHSYLPL